MMYKFEDTIKHDVVDSSLPAEAMNWNGSFLEKQITGYRTLGVEGRELATTTITTSEMETVDGTKTIAKKRSPRTITVYYQLISESYEAFREAYNKLNGLLTKERTRFYFNDEPDKYFEGISTTAYDVPRGRNAITSSFDIYCDIPYKYALNLSKYTASMSADNILSMEVDNRGTVETPLSVRAEIKDDNGYFGIVGPNAAMEFGAIDEVDGYVDKMERAWYYKMLPSEASKFTVNNGVLNWATSSANLPNKQQGSFNWTGETAKVTDFGTVQTDNRWYGPSLSLSIPAKPADGLRTGNWRYHSWLNLKAGKDPKKIGRQEFNISGGGKSIACFTIIDPYGSNYQTNLEFWVLGKKMRTVIAGGDFKEFYGCAEIRKQDDEIIFKLSTDTGKTYTCRFSDDAILTAKPDKWTYWVSTYKKYKTCFMSINSVVFD